jgi:hypothetical protein
MYVGFYFEKQKERNGYEDLGVDGSIVFSRI